ncbi:type I restriction/modification system, R subunit [Campylobacter hyointestinalis subsp. lawsonii CCUG 27631]|uniref:type I restriction endonuclease subunit R n=1 Tax=Campylobacter hyointestinalis TaxID=198 RepID=UPI0007C88021|nr:type I restriction endonuclease subunit R [Campylobacter hyointestinalis]ANE35043.1 type I restriction/modification system, R subunit [Campylobacter hyointestinalis subsp. lawsonii CCUG 27631]
MNNYNVIMEMTNATVVAEYEPLKKKSDSYQSEAALENEFIKMLSEQGYEYLKINDSKALISNLRTQLEILNDYKFSDNEWDRFYKNSIANNNDGIVQKTKKIQEDHIQVLKKDDGTSRNIYLIDKKNIHNNILQVINQYVEKGGNYENRYDVSVLVNGLPLIHIELKRRGVALKEAFNQINRYQKDSFWAGSGLYEYIQIFVISNGTNTKYYSNTTRESHIKEKTQTKSKKTSNSFEFTSYWADASNKIISDLVDFTRTFFSKHTILNILTKYCVFTAEELLLVMRPYQIAATERILNKIQISTNYKKMGTIEAGGYIWHTTGSGKTLTSFKTAQLASKLDYIDKVLFVVDRKDLDYQTMREYDRFEKGAANGNRNTKILQKQIEDDNAKIIVTTIQKLSEFVKRNPTHPAFQKHLVLIFDECHRSQFGDMHISISKSFKNYHLFGFTGTPIFAKNAINKSNLNFSTTEQVFGDKLHTYTIVDAINDGNVLPFRIDFVNTIKKKDEIKDKEVARIDEAGALEDNKRVKKIVEYIIEHFDQKTKRNSFYDLKGQRMSGFNSMFAVSSIPMAKKYYLEFKKQLEEKQKDLTIATIFSFAANEEDTTIIDDEGFETELLDKSSREFLDFAINEYNKKFKTNFSSEGNGFQDYYKDLSDKVKKREVDLLIVVNMFLTGFDATTLNTLWVDKNLKQHGLIQAFSRTNRILNSVKSYGNIVCFRDLQQETNDAIALFGDKNASGIVLLRSFEDYYYGYDDDKKHIMGYEEKISQLIQKYPLGEQIIGESAKRDFIISFGSILRLTNILSSFDKFKGMEILSEGDFMGYLGKYTDLNEEFKSKSEDSESIKDDLVFEMELVRQLEVNIDYILMLVTKYHKSNCKDQEIRNSIDKAIRASMSLRSKKDLIDGFINKINADTDVMTDWAKFVKEQKESDLKDLIKEENLKESETRKFLDNSFRDGQVKTIGTDIEKILPPMGRFNGGNRNERKQAIIEKLLKFFDKYFGLGV